MQIERKITIGGINGIRKGFKDVTESRLVARILGIASEALREDGALGEYVKFKGEFRAINQDGEEFASAVCFLPKPADDLLESAIKNAGGKSVNFGFDIFVHPNENVAIGYEYKVKPLLETKPSDPLAALMGAIAPLQLAAPKAAPGPDAPAADVPAASEKAKPKK